ncbi:hypothetical protein BDV96DRAFT_582142 [Lophiotrema nucula]|uniref:BRCT domain-containing protein n=1 Tax=Lophiotrema nucula TaxID=690887 RepID=A0A6A5YZ77_9PLEO|nr:hypothetical protein BDV96DRAFT_582142 [Lophiotrema nucula]
MADIGGYGTSQMPLAGAILCCTSIPPEQRAELAQMGAQMGATIKLDLTSDVTHLIVGSINSAKYRYVAKAREDVKVLLPDWLEALRTVWMEGDDVDVAVLEKQYRLPTFCGLKICLTGFDNPDQRRFIQEAVVQNGAEYHGDLTKSVTHLIAAMPAGKKYEHAVNWRMKVVSWEWFQHSLERGMALDEDYYNPSIPKEERGKGAWDRREDMSPTLGKRAREAEQSHAINPLRRKLRRSASSKMGSQSEALWAGITAAGLERPKNTDDDWTENIANDGLQRENSPSSQSEVPPHSEIHQPEFSYGQDLPDDAQPEDPASASRRSRRNPTRNDGIFGGRVVFPYGFDGEKTGILAQHLESNGALAIRSSGELEDFSPDDLRRGFLVVPHDVASDLTSLPGASGAMSLVTNWWVERCLHGKCLVDPTENVLCRPFDVLSISGFNDLVINSTAFTGIELLHVTKAVTLMGAAYDEYLSPKISVLVSNTRRPNPEKLKFATDKRIPTVHADWLWDCLQTGKLQPFDNYTLNKLPSQPQRIHQKPQGHFTEVPTAPLSEEDSAKLRQKKAQSARHASKPRNGVRRPGALDLTLSTDPTPLSTGSSTNPDTSTHRTPFDLDSPTIGGYNGNASQPLGELDPSMNSPRRPSISSNISSEKAQSKPNSATTASSNSSSELLIKPPPKQRKTSMFTDTREPTPDSVIPPESATEPEPPTKTPADLEPAPQKDFTGIMSEIVAARKAAAASAKDPDTEDPKKRRRRQLGRAQSTRSNPSTADDVLSLSRASSGSKVIDGDEIERGAGGYKEYLPSQELGWDAEGLGGMGVGEVAVVKDVVRDPGLGRAGRRKRAF